MNDVFITQELTYRSIFGNLGLTLSTLDEDDENGNVEHDSNTKSEFSLD